MSDNDQNYIDKINQLTSQPATPGQPGNLADGVDQMTSGSHAMLTQARSGALRFDPATGQSLIAALTAQIKTLEGMEPRIKRISQETKLGMTAGGQAMSKFNDEVAVSGAKAFVPAHNQFIQTLKTAVQAIQIAMDNYAETEADNALNLKSKD